MNIDKDSIIAFTKIHPSRVSNIYLYGSRVYGTNTEDSDYDFIVLGSNQLERQELKLYTPDNKQYNIHICVPNKFEDDLRAHDIHCLECIWAPDFAKVQIKKDYAQTFIPDAHRLKLKLLTQSHDSWHKAQLKMNESDIYRGMKSLYHSLRILMFGVQIIDNGKILNFEEGKELYNEIVNTEQYEWRYFQQKYFPLKKELERQFLRERVIR